MITTRKIKDKRSFYEKGRRIAFYTLEETASNDIRASIYGKALNLGESVNSLGVNKSHIKIFGFTKICEFLSAHMESGLADLMLKLLEWDFNVFFEKNPKERIVFT